MKTRIKVLLPLLAMLTLPAAVQAQFTFTTNNGAITITKYTGSDGSVTIPDTTNGLPVTSIGTNAFNRCTSLTNVTIGTNVTSIEFYGFANCYNLTGVTIGANLTNIGDYAFASCWRLISVNLPNSLSSIGGSAFVGCSSLTNITIPSSVIIIGDWAFSSTGLTGVTIPNSVTSIGYRVFCNCQSLTRVTIPDSVEIIGARAFDTCTSLTNVNIPNSVTNIGTYAFTFCNSLNRVIIPNSVSGIGDGVFAECASLTSVTIGTNVTDIAQWAFEHCTSLTSVIIPNSITNIGGFAFANCTSLTNVTIPSSVASIEDWAFGGCGSLTAITVDALNSVYSSVAGVLFNKNQTTLILCPGGKAGTYAISNSVTSIAGEAFSGCNNLISVTIPDSVTNIMQYAFQSCWRLTTITVDALNSVYSSVAGVLFNKSQTTLIHCPGGKAGTYAISNSVTSIGAYAFEACHSLTSIAIPSSVTSIGDWAFSACSSLTGVYFKGNPPSIGSYPTSLFSANSIAAVYWLPGTTGWNPQIQTGGAGFGARTNRFGFTITGSNGVAIVVQACTNITNSIWSSVGTNTLNGGSSYFSDPRWTNYSARFYRLWSPTFGGRPTALWFLPNPLILNNSPSFGVQTNRFGFIISWATNVPVVVEACTDLASHDWSPVGTNTLIGGWSYFSDPHWTNYPARLYRLRSP